MKSLKNVIAGLMKRRHSKSENDLEKIIGNPGNSGENVERVFADALKISATAYAAIELGGAFNTASVVASYLLGGSLYWKDELKKRPKTLIYRALFSAALKRPVLDLTIYLLNPEDPALNFAYKSLVTIGVLYPWAALRCLTLDYLVNTKDLKGFMGELD